MRTSKTFSIRFWVNPKKVKNKSALLYARITVNPKRVEISLKRKVHLDLWEGKNKKLLGHSSEVKQINRYLEETRVRFFQIFQDLKLSRSFF